LLRVKAAYEITRMRAEDGGALAVPVRILRWGAGKAPRAAGRRPNSFIV